jgi:peptidoglycan-associated lipoprotein
MYPKIRLLSLLSIFSLTLLALTGCGEKRVHVATVSGAPGDESSLASTDGISEPQTISGLDNASIGESALLPQTPDGQENSAEPPTSAMNNEPINLPHEATNLSSPDGPLESSLSDPIVSSLSPDFSDNNSSVASLAEGQDFSAQSSSAPGDQSSQPIAKVTDFQKLADDAETSDSMTSPASQDSSDELKNLLAGEDFEPIPDTLQIAKADPSDVLQNQINRLKAEELAASAAGLEDVFFQFDSWRLTQEGKQSLERALKWLEEDPSSKLLIEGHADQRGTQAYNMVLAKKRAVAVKDYLSQLGVDTSRMAIISYGKDKPFCQEATEVCYQLNRRGHLLAPNE